MEILPKDILNALRDAQSREAGRRSRLRVQVGDDVWPVLRRWRGGFALNADQVTHLRGLVDLYEGSRHISTALIVASDVEGGELICTIKRDTPVSDRAALDFERNENAPVGYLPPA
ncbi:hypothetical protein [Paenirhodobacter sp. CAU 1674]|jgi:hypothetical protein|uniref:hypothetical protein n=1 Tax=Paenirhodobacter sp. CAU 1674 TaxID=3032596 RepID=UPI0023DA963F|nr:hypothetical protein [Paenirhodobacter sp. CAU 1674]MDF2141116.1 hypothetical protein [Paenirhodobacter sp. CAU 1674]